MHVGSHTSNPFIVAPFNVTKFLLDKNFAQPSYLGITEIILFNTIKLHPRGKGRHRLYEIISMGQRNKSSPMRIDSKRAIFLQAKSLAIWC